MFVSEAGTACPECGEEKIKVLGGAQWVGIGDRLLSGSTMMSRSSGGGCFVVRSPSSCTSESLGWHLPVECNIVGSDASFIYVQTSWWRVAILPLLKWWSMCWLLRLRDTGGHPEIRRLDRAFIASCHSPVPAMAQLGAERLSTCDTRRPQASLCFLTYKCTSNLNVQCTSWCFER